MSGGRLLWRRLVSAVMLAGAGVTTIIAVIPLFSTLFFVARMGLPALNLEFLTQLPKPVGEPGGGMANAIAGSLLVVALAVAVGLPIGLGAGIYLAEFGRNRFGEAVRFVADVLTGVPSIIVGIFIYTLVVVPMKGFSALAGGLALAVILIPIVTRTTEEMLRLVPVSLREAGLALGAPYWRVVLKVVLRGARGGIVTGVMLGVARIAGETAPLLFTALNSSLWPTGLGERVSTLPVQIFTYAITPYDELHAKAWAGAMVLVLLVLGLSLVARLFAGGRRVVWRR